MRILLLLVLLFLPGPAVADEPIDINDPKTMFLLVEVQEEIDFISSAVLGCLDAGREHSECMCENKAMISHFTETVNDLFVSCPELKGQDLVTFKAPDGVQVTQSLAGIRKQTEMKLVCSE